MVLGLFVRGDLTFGDFVALSCSEMAGGFFGAVLVYVMYMPHFRTLPELGPESPEDNLLRTRDHIDPSALRIASYSTKPSASSQGTLAQRIAEARYYLSNASYDDEPEKVMQLLSGGTFMLHGVEVPFPDDEIIGELSSAESSENVDVEAGAAKPSTTPAGATDSRPKIKRRHSLQVAEMQRMLRKLEKDLKSNADTEDDSNLSQQRPAISSTTVGPSSSSAHNVPFSTTHLHPPSSNGSSEATKRPRSLNRKASKASILTLSAAKNRESAIAKAATLADQATKLSVFATRPAIYLPIHNFIVETIATAVLILGAMLIDDRFVPLDNTAGVRSGIDATFKPYYIGLYVMVLVLALAGPTGLAANPARDMAPRLAHWLLPIPGKGGSELIYGVIINIGAMLGGALGAGIYMGIHMINKTK
jgi:glycerol uptake facilitator-like aquaporin